MASATGSPVGAAFQKDTLSCTRNTGPAGLTVAQWTERAAPPPGLFQQGFSTSGFIARDGKRLRTKIYRPSRFDPKKGPIWFVMHGVDRDADRYIDAAAPVAERHQALAIVIEFSKRDYPASENYTLGVATHGRIDGSALRKGRWRKPEAYLYNEVERVFEAVRIALGGSQPGYYLFGHSAGAQFTHRLLTFVPCARVLGAVAANAGWYTLPVADKTVPYSIPYSLRDSPLAAANQRALLAAPLTLLLGTRDTRDAAADRNVRDTPEAMAQGRNRLARGQYYFETGRKRARALGTPFAWKLAQAPGAGHDVRQVIASAGHLLFATNETSCTPSTAAQAGQLVFSEVLADPPPGLAGDLNLDGVRRAADEEFAELVNTGTAPLCLTGWTLDEASGRGGHLFPLGKALAPGQAVLVFGGGVPVGAFGGAQVQRASAAAGLALDGPGDVLSLRDSEGRLARQLSWGNCSGRPCAADHWPGSLRINASLARGQGPTGPWRKHTDLAATPASPGLRADGNPW
ncbi:MAG: lamin tail domain-containing protein [Thiobacillus sp.]